MTIKLVQGEIKILIEGKLSNGMDTTNVEELK